MMRYPAAYYNWEMEKRNLPRYHPYHPDSQMTTNHGRSTPWETTSDDLRAMLQDLAHEQELSARATARELRGIRSHLDDLEVWKEEVSFKIAELNQRQVAAMTVIEISDDSADETENVQEVHCAARNGLGIDRDALSLERSMKHAAQGDPEPVRSEPKEEEIESHADLLHEKLCRFCSPGDYLHPILHDLNLGRCTLAANAPSPVNWGRDHEQPRSEEDSDEGEEMDLEENSAELIYEKLCPICPSYDNPRPARRYLDLGRCETAAITPPTPNKNVKRKTNSERIFERMEKLMDALEMEMPFDEDYFKLPENIRRLKDALSSEFDLLHNYYEGLNDEDGPSTPKRAKKDANPIPGRDKEHSVRDVADPARLPGARVLALRLVEDDTDRELVNLDRYKVHPVRDEESTVRSTPAVAAPLRRSTRKTASQRYRDLFSVPKPRTKREVLEAEKRLENFVRHHNQVYFPRKRKDPGGFIIDIGIRGRNFGALCDLGANVSLIPLKIWNELELGELRPERCTVSLADGSYTRPSKSDNDVLLKIGKHYVTHDFLVGDIAVDPVAPIIVGRPFLATVNALINVGGGRMTFNINGHSLKFYMYDEFTYISGRGAELSRAKRLKTKALTGGSPSFILTFFLL